MNSLFIAIAMACVIGTASAAPEAGYSYNKDTAPVVEHGNLNGFKPIAGSALPPCAHAAHSHGDSVGAGAALVQSQSQGRILNHQHHHGEQSLETAASGYTPQSQAVTVNSHIVVGDSGTAASSFSAGSQEYRPGQGYVQAPQQYQPQPAVHQPQAQFPPQPPPQFNPLPQLPQPLPPQPFNPGSLPPNKVVPSQVLSGQTQGYAYNQGSVVSGAQHTHHHYTSGGSAAGAVINGIGKVPPPPSYQPPNKGYSSNRFISPPQTSYGTPVNFAGPAPYRPPGPVSAGPVGNVGAPRPVQHFGSASNTFDSSSYAGSFSHNAQYSGGVQQFGGANAGHGASSFGSTQGQTLNSGANLFNTASSFAQNNVLGGQLGNVIRETFATAPLDPTVEKHIYVHVPPEDLEENTAGKHSINALPSPTQTKKHYKIIFIKAPSVAQPNYAQMAQIASQQSEEKTLVYVLVKKPDEPSLEEIQQIQQATIKSHKPEVYFIKYKTRKEGEVPAYTGNTQFATDGTSNQFATIGGGYNSVLENSNSGSYSSGSGSEIDGSGNIDIRLTNGGVGGESSGGVTTSTSYSTSSSSTATSSGINVGESSGQKHELYGVPLE